MWKQALSTGVEFVTWLVIVALAASSFGQQAEQPAKEAKEKGGKMPASFAESKLIPRDVLFGNPERAMARLSPDGKWLAFLAPIKEGQSESSQGVLNGWVAPAGDLDASKPVTGDKVRGIRGFSWA